VIPGCAAKKREKKGEGVLERRVPKKKLSSRASWEGGWKKMKGKYHLCPETKNKEKGKEKKKKSSLLPGRKGRTTPSPLWRNRRRKGSRQISGQKGESKGKEKASVVARKTAKKKKVAMFFEKRRRKKREREREGFSSRPV